MILAAAGHAEDNKLPPPPELELARQAVYWSTLPRAGGLLEQPAGLLEKMRQALEVWKAFRAWKEADPLKQAAWKKAHPAEWKIVKSVRELRAILNRDEQD